MNSLSCEMVCKNHTPTNPSIFFKKQFYEILQKEDIEIFESHRNGEFSITELRDFNTRLECDTDFKREFEQYQLLEFGINACFRNKLKEKLKGVDEQIDKKANVLKLVIWSLFVAALIEIKVIISI